MKIEKIKNEKGDMPPLEHKLYASRIEGRTMFISGKMYPIDIDLREKRNL